jgi:hypothetical protein
MSEWYPCPKCGVAHENLCACPEQQVVIPDEEKECPAGRHSWVDLGGGIEMCENCEKKRDYTTSPEDDLTDGSN